MALYISKHILQLLMCIYRIQNVYGNFLQSFKSQATDMKMEYICYCMDNE